MSVKASSSFKIVNLNYENGGVEADIELNDQHDVFSGHFPGNPIVPGVLNIEIIHAIMKEALGECEIAKIVQIKFLKPVVPGTTPELLYLIKTTQREDGLIGADVKGTVNDEVHVKAQIHLRKA